MLRRRLPALLESIEYKEIRDRAGMEIQKLLFLSVLFSSKLSNKA